MLGDPEKLSREAMGVVEFCTLERNEDVVGIDVKGAEEEEDGRGWGGDECNG